MRRGHIHSPPPTRTPHAPPSDSNTRNTLKPPNFFNHNCPERPSSLCHPPDFSDAPLELSASRVAREGNGIADVLRRSHIAHLSNATAHRQRHKKTARDSGTGNEINANKTRTRELDMCTDTGHTSTPPLPSPQPPPVLALKILFCLHTSRSNPRPYPACGVEP